MRKKGILISGFIVIVILLGSVFYQKVYLPKATFKTVAVKTGDFPVWIRGIGELDAQFIYDLGFPITGRVMQLNADQGDHVVAKQLLAKLDDVELKASLAEAQATYAKTVLEITSTQREIELNQEQYDLSKLTFNRYQKMLKTGNISQEQFDFAKSNMLKSKISLETAKIKLALSKAEVVRVSKNIEVVKAKLHYTQLHTPVSGVLVERLVEKGQSVAAAQTVVRVLDPSSLWVRSYIDERISGAISVGQPAIITLRSMPNNPFKGIVKRIDFQSDKVTQEHVVYVGFSEPINQYYLNEQAEVSILTKTLSSVKILPIDTLATYHKASGVWVDRHSKAYFVALDILSVDDDAFAFKAASSLNDPVLVMQKGKKPLSNGVGIYP